MNERGHYGTWVGQAKDPTPPRGVVEGPPPAPPVEFGSRWWHLPLVIGGGVLGVVLLGGQLYGMGQMYQAAIDDRHIDTAARRRRIQRS